jgi:hypothetical protein
MKLSRTSEGFQKPAIVIPSLPEQAGEATEGSDLVGRNLSESSAAARIRGGEISL